MGPEDKCEGAGASASALSSGRTGTPAERRAVCPEAVSIEGRHHIFILGDVTGGWVEIKLEEVWGFGMG